MPKVMGFEVRKPLDDLIYTARLEKVENKEYDSGATAIKLTFSILNKKFKNYKVNANIWTKENEEGVLMASSKTGFMLLCKLSGTEGKPVNPKDYVGKDYKISIEKKADKNDPEKIYTNVKDIFPITDEDEAEEPKGKKSSAVDEDEDEDENETKGGKPSVDDDEDEDEPKKRKKDNDEDDLD